MEERKRVRMNEWTEGTRKGKRCLISKVAMTEQKDKNSRRLSFWYV